MSQRHSDKSARAPYMLHSVFQHVCRRWKGTLAVVACIAILHCSDWLHAIDSYAFLAIGNVAARPAPAATSWPHTVVVRIDEPSFHSRYAERSPLDRCELREQLQAIYDAKPDVVVIDIDISPALWLAKKKSPENEPEFGCETGLYADIAAAERNGIHTVLMEPFETDNAATASLHREWQLKMQDQGISVANADLPVAYGVTSSYFDDDHTLYAATRHRRILRGAATAPAAERHQERIDPRTYAGTLRVVLTSWTDEDDATLTDTLHRWFWLKPHELDAESPRVVFFGAGYGTDNVHLTPVGEFYGVEVHAAAFVSERQPHPIHPAALARVLALALALALDLVMALLFGAFFGRYWRQFFRSRLHGNALLSWSTGRPLLLLAAVLSLGAGVAVLLSWWLLGRFGIWLSPIPIAIGMFFEGCITESVAEASSLLTEPKEPHDKDSDNLHAVADTPQPSLNS